MKSNDTSWVISDNAKRFWFTKPLLIKCNIAQDKYKIIKHPIMEKRTNLSCKAKNAHLLKSDEGLTCLNERGIRRIRELRIAAMKNFAGRIPLHIFSFHIWRLELEVPFKDCVCTESCGVLGFLNNFPIFEN